MWKWSCLTWPLAFCLQALHIAKPAQCEQCNKPYSPRDRYMTVAMIDLSRTMNHPHQEGQDRFNQGPLPQTAESRNQKWNRED